MLRSPAMLAKAARSRAGTHRRFVPGWWLAMLALALQLSAIVAMPWQAAAASADPLLSAPICHAGPAADTRHPAPAPLDRHACAVCPLCGALAQAAALIGPEHPAVPLPRPAGRATPLPPSRAPPPRLASVHPPATGPPAIA